MKNTKKWMAVLDVYDPNLTLSGMRLIYEKQNRK